ncbi:MAG: histidine phosphatase family protein [Dehalococcoidia bacterium]
MTEGAIVGERRLVLHLVRHAETDWNAERRIQGQLKDVALSANGREQARAIAEELASASATLIIASDLDRTMQTAQIIAGRLALPVTPEPALRERHFGIVEGQLYADVAKLVDGWWQTPDHRVEGGESNREMYDRVARCLERLVAEPPADEIILVTHGGTMNMAVAWLAGVPVDAHEWQRFDNCALRTVVVEPLDVSRARSADGPPAGGARNPEPRTENLCE